MAAFVGSGKGGAKAEINITPLVDVVLVLLIIFMVISPGNSTYIPNAIPRKAEIDDSVVLSSEQMVLELFADGTAMLNRKSVVFRNFGTIIEEIMEQRTDRKMFIAVEDELPYGEVVSWMGVARSSGVKTLSIHLKEPVAQVASATAES